MDAMPAGFGDTHVTPTATSTQPPQHAAAVATSAKQPDKLAAIQILTGPSAGKELELVKNLTTLGKPGVQVAVITRRPHGYFITHVEGARMPVVNGKALDSQGASAQRSRRGRTGGRENGIFLQALLGQDARPCRAVRPQITIDSID
jgi:hypothetical protein